MTSPVSSPPPFPRVPEGEGIRDPADLQTQRRHLYERLRHGASAAEIVGAFTELIDRMLVGRYRDAVRRGGRAGALESQHCCLVAVGGYGRRELAPFSDIDVMILFRTGESDMVTRLSKELFHHLWDLGFQVGHSVRSIADCLALAETDVSARTALMESRFLAGDAGVFQAFRARFARAWLARRASQFIQQKIEERERDYTKFGETVFLLEPNIKKSKGGLRDLHLLLWTGMARYRAATLQELANRGLLTHEDYLALLEGREFLWRVRCLMHFEAGRAQDILTFDEQLRLAAHFGYVDQPHMLAVEQFMQRYYRHTTGLHDRCRRFLDRAKAGSWWRKVKRWMSPPSVEDGVRVYGDRVTIPKEHLPQMLDEPERLVRFFQIAQTRSLDIETEVLEELPRHLKEMPNEQFHTVEVSRVFREILSKPGGIARILELMHRACLLEKLVPAFARVRGLMQFNQYHKYTVDEHSILAVREAERLAKNPGIVGTIYADIPEKDLLHLALLLHDLGKGRPEDHSEAGRIIAERTAERLGFTARESSALQFLVHRHLLLSDTAFRRDLHDEKVIVTLAREVRTLEMLRMLLILTIADISAVGPEVMTKWKEALLVELFSRTATEISGEREAQDRPEERRRLAEAIVQKSREEEAGISEPLRHLVKDIDWVEERLAGFPMRYITNTAPERALSHLVSLQDLSREEPLVEGRFDPVLKICEYTLMAYESVKPGMFMQVTGVLAALGLQVLDAHIMTRSDGIVVDTFFVNDPDYEGEPPERRRQRVREMVKRVLMGEESVERLMAQGRRIPLGKPFPVDHHPTEVQIDNEVSDHCTVIDVFAEDRQGLLYVIAKTLYELGLSVHAARIGTRLDQVVDVFYVSGAEGKKLDDQETCERVRSTIYATVEQFLKQPQP